MNAKSLFFFALVSGSTLVAWQVTKPDRVPTRADVRPERSPDVARETPRPLQELSDLEGRLSVPNPASKERDAAPQELFEQLSDAALNMRPEELAPLIERWLTHVDDPIESALTVFDRLGDDELGSRAAGMLLQACMLYAENLPSSEQAWTRAALAAEILARSDASPWASSVCRTAVAAFAADVPPQELAAFLLHTGSEDLVHTSQSSFLQRLFLINDLAAGMPPEVMETLGAVVGAPDASTRSRGLAANALMHRDWRGGAERLVELLGDDEVELSRTAESEVRASLSGYFIELHGRDRLELLREVVADDATARMSLCGVSLDQAAELDAMATQADRDWPEYEWVDLALGGDRGYAAGLRLMDRLSSKADQVYAAQVIAQMLPEYLGDPTLSERLDRRFAARNEASDPYWGTLASVAHRLDVAAVYQEVIPRLQTSHGETNVSRGVLLQILDQRFPELGLSSF